MYFVTFIQDREVQTGASQSAQPCRSNFPALTVSLQKKVKNEAAFSSPVRLREQRGYTRFRRVRSPWGEEPAWDQTHGSR